MQVWQKVWTILGGIIAVLLVGTVLFFITCMTFVDKHELGFTFDRFTGEIKQVDHSGWVITPPIRYSVNKIDLRPYQVSISANERILNAKLVRFDPAGLDTFIAWHGREAANNLEDLKEILKCYAFDKQNGADCPFLIIDNEISPDQGAFIVD